jgi:Ca-activated chloride channel family protein
LAHVKLRYKEPQAQASQLLDVAIVARDGNEAAQASRELRFAAAVAGFGQLLRGGQYTGAWSFADARKLAQENVGPDRFGYRAELLRLIELAQSLATRAPTLGEAAVAR